MKTTIDFHTHLLEKNTKPKEYWKAVKAKKLDAVAITEHVFENPSKAYQKLLEKKPKTKTLIPGMELETSIGHVLALAEDPLLFEIEALYKKGIKIKKTIKIAEKEKILLSIAHPWGLDYDSAAYLYGERKLNALVEKEKIGVEAFNGLVGNVGSFFYDSNWVKKPMNFFDYLEKSKLAKKTRLNKIGQKGKEKLDDKAKEILERCTKPFELAQKASFVTAGSDAHSPNRIGTGITKLKTKKSPNPKEILDALQNKKNVEWIGPNVKETQNGYKMEKTPIQKKELISGVKYAAKQAIIKKVKKRIKKR